MHISSHFDSGNIRVINADSPDNIVLGINNDNQSEFYQWFHFRLATDPFETHSITTVSYTHLTLPTILRV